MQKKRYEIPIAFIYLAFRIIFMCGEILLGMVIAKMVCDYIVMNITIPAFFVFAAVIAWMAWVTKTAMDYNKEKAIEFLGKCEEHMRRRNLRW